MGDSFVIEVTAQNFEREVIERSQNLPIVIDFWAPWCGPCRVLSPVLEKLASEYEGRFLLAKVDIDREPELARQFGIRSIPAVIGVRDRKGVSAFVGVQAESAIRTWLKGLLPTPAESNAALAAEMELSDPPAAAALYNTALELDPNLPAAHLGLARMALAEGRLEDAQAGLLALERRGFLEPDAEKLKAELTLRLQAQQAGGMSLDAARAASAANPSDLNRKFELAEALAAAGQYADALALCLGLVERDRKGIGEKARQTMIAIFRLLPADSELVTEYQRQLSLLLME
jgi:putative thioredoxin